MKKLLLPIFLILGITMVLSFVSAESNMDYGSSNFSTYNGAGTYTLSPGDQVTLDGGYFLKYVSYQKDASWQRMQQTVTGDEAYLGLYNGAYNSLNIGQNQAYSFSVSDIDTEMIKTFSSGFYFNITPLEKDSKRVEITIDSGILSGCTDTDMGHVDSNSNIWGLNYLMKGKVWGTTEGINGRTERNEEDICLNNKNLREYYCFDSKIKSTEYTCPGECKDGACVSSIPDTSQVTMSIIEEGTYLIKKGTTINVNQISANIVEISWALSGDTEPKLWINGNNAQVCNPHVGEECSFNYGSVTQPISKNLKIKVNSINKNEDKPDDSTASITVTKLNETYKYPEPFPVVRARTWFSNNYDEEMSCKELCEEYNTVIVIDGCYDKNLKRCTVMDGGVCIKGDENYVIKKDYSTSCCCKGSGNFRGCTDTDGFNPFVKGRCIDNGGNVYEDKCEASTVIDYLCSSTGFHASYINDVVCPNGCEDGACKKIEIEPTKESGPIDVPNKVDQEPEFNSFVCSGCALDKKCYPYGFRKDGNYCDDKDNKFITQMKPDSSCQNNFECKSNVCVNSECISEGLIKSILNWFRRLFGGE